MALYRLFVSLVLVIGLAGLVGGCGEDSGSLTCGSGTHEENGECVADGDDKQADGGSETDTTIGSDKDAGADEDAGTVVAPCDGILEGDYTIENQIDVDALAGYCEITGDLIVSDTTALTSFDLPALTSVGGYLKVYGSSAIPVELVVDGAEIQFPWGSTYLYVGWSGPASFTATDATFTSAESSPAAGDWAGILVGSYANPFTLENTTVSYGGSSTSYPGNISCYYCTASITDSALEDSLYYGIYAYGSYSITESGNSYAGNGYGDTYPDPL